MGLRRGSLAVLGLAIAVLFVVSCGRAAAPTPTPGQPPAPSPTPTLTVALPATPLATPPPSPSPTPLPLTTPYAIVPTPTPVGPFPTPTIDPRAKRGGVVKTSHRRTPTTFDLMDTTTIDDLGTVTPAYNELFMMAPNDFTRLVGDLARDWHFSDDGKTLTIRIHPGVKDHEGNPFTADDVRWSLERITDPRLNLLNRTLFVDVWERIETPDETTVVLHLTTPQASILTKLATQYIPMMTREPWEKGKKPSETAIGTGPWVLTRYVPGERMEFTRNTNYFKPGLPYADGLHIIAIRDGATRLAAFLTKQIDLILLGSSHGITEENWKDAERRHPGQITWYVGVHYANRGISFNVGKAGSPFADKRVRQAVDLAVSRQNALKSMPESTIYGLYVPPTNIWGYSIDEVKAMLPFREDKTEAVARAKQLLEAAGYAAGFEVKALCRDTADYKDLHCPFVAFELQKIGIRTTLDVKETASWQEERVNRRHTVEYGVGVAAPADDPDFFLSVFLCNVPTNYYNYCNSRYDELYKKQQATVDFQARSALVKQLQDILREDVPFVDIWWAARVGGYWNYVRNAPLERFSGQYSQARRLEYVWLDR